MKKYKKYSPSVPHLLQAQQALALLYAKVAGRPGTGSYPAPSPSPTAQICVLWSHYSAMSSGRINKRIFNYALNRGSPRLTNWQYRATRHLNSIGCTSYTNMDQAINKLSMTRQVKSCRLDNYKAQWGPNSKQGSECKKHK